MKSTLLGTGTSSPVTSIAATGFWLLAEDKEYFVPFADYPVFKKATIAQIFAVEQIAPGQLRWETLDADLDLDALERPENHPLIWKE